MLASLKCILISANMFGLNLNNRSYMKAWYDVRQTNHSQLFGLAIFNFLTLLSPIKFGTCLIVVRPTFLNGYSSWTNCSKK